MTLVMRLVEAGDDDGRSGSGKVGCRIITKAIFIHLASLKKSCRTVRRQLRPRKVRTCPPT